MAAPIETFQALPAILRDLSMGELKNFAQRMRGLPSGGAAIQDEFGRETPQEFILDVLGERPTDAARAHGIEVPWTPDQERIFDSVVKNRRTACPSGVSTGKTYAVSRIALWWLYRRPRSIVVTTGPGERQIKVLLWGEISDAFKGSRTPLPGNLQSLKLTLDEKTFAIGVPIAERLGQISATTFQGYHSDYVLVIYEEATGVISAAWEGGTGIAVGADDRQLAIGNPTDPSSHFAEVCRSGLWNVIRLDCRNHPNVTYDDAKIIPGATTTTYVEEALDEYGEGSPLYKSKVCGEFPDQSTDALIMLSWIEAAEKRWKDDLDETEEDDRGTALGIDVASEGDDLTVLWAIRNGRCWVPKIADKYAWHVGRNVMDAVGLIRAALREIRDVRAMAIDDTGIGNAVTGRLRELQREKKLPRWRAGGITKIEGRDIAIFPYNFGASAASKQRFVNVKSELWWRVREALRQERISLPYEHEVARYSLPRGSDLRGQVVRPVYEATKKGGRIEVFDKKGSAERAQQLPSKSPDVAHGLMLAVEAWNRLQPIKTPPPVTTTQQIFDAQVREAIDKTRRKPKRRGAPKPPWMKGGRRR